MAIDLSPILADLRHNRHAAAKTACLALLEAHADDFGLHQVMAIIALAEDQPAAAAASAAKALALNSEHPPALLLAGKAARSLGRLPEALDLFRRAAARAPDRGEPAFLVCAVLLEQGDPAAVSLLDPLLARFPDDAPGWAEIGRVLQEAGKHAAALVALDRAERLRPSAAIATRRGAALQALGRAAEAIEALRSACVLAPRSPEALTRLAQAFAAQRGR